MPRQKLKDRRAVVTSKVEHTNATGDKIELLISFGFDDEGQVREVFSANPMVGSDIHAILTDACILISIYLQTGGEPERLVRSLGENREEGKDRGPPSSILGSIARAIVDIQQSANKGEFQDAQT